MMADDFASLQSAISSGLISTTRSVSALAGEDLPFHRSLDASVGTKLDRQNARLLGLASSLLGSARPATETVRGPPSLKDVEGIENNWRTVVDVVDSLLDSADTALDDFAGAVRRLSPGADVQVCRRRVLVVETHN
jgi:exosome complex exonuclease RRP6